MSLDGLPALHLKALLDGLPVFERYGLLLAGGYAFRAHEIMHRPSQTWTLPLATPPRCLRSQSMSAPRRHPARQTLRRPRLHRAPRRMPDSPHHPPQLRRPYSLTNLGLYCTFHHLIAIHQWGFTIALNPDGTTTMTSPGKTRTYHSPPTAAA